MRKCKECDKPMMDGFLIDDGLEYYCSEPCLHKHITEEQYGELYQKDAAYWTEWEDMSCDNCGDEETAGYIKNGNFFCKIDCADTEEEGEAEYVNLLDYKGA